MIVFKDVFIFILGIWVFYLHVCLCMWVPGTHKDLKRASDPPIDQRIMSVDAGD